MHRWTVGLEVAVAFKIKVMRDHRNGFSEVVPHAVYRVHNGPARVTERCDCQSARNSGSDSLLMHVDAHLAGSKGESAGG